jgi:amino acid adenylation domain-containing protein/thioester reductase-like protein
LGKPSWILYYQDWQKNKCCQQPDPNQQAMREIMNKNETAPICKPDTIASIEDMYPLTPLQQGLLYHSLAAPDSGVYTEQLTCIFEGDLDVAVFFEAWRQVVDANAILRTAFVWADLDQPLQVVLKSVQLPFAQQDWRELAIETQATRWSEFLEADRKRGFDVDHAPLMRMTLIRRLKTSYYFVWTHHHALLDGWCLSLIIKDLFAFYESLRRGQAVHAMFRRPYRDYIAWLSKQDRPAAEHYWRNRLSGFANPTTLTLGASGSNRTEGAKPEEKRLCLAQADSLLLNAMIKQHHLTLNTLVQGAWALLLGRYSGDHDILFGVTVAGRPAELTGVEEMLGLFINALPLRLQIRPDALVKDWLQALQNQNLEMRRFEYASLVDIQGWSEIARGQLMFQSLLVFENYPLDKMVNDAVSSLAVTEICFIEQTNYPLTLVVHPGEQLEVRIIYDSVMFEDTSIDGLLNHLEILLKGMIASPDSPLSELPLMASSEYHQIVHDWNDTLAHYPQGQCIHKLFEAYAEHSPESVALVFDEKQLSYGELNAQANQLAHYLLGQGVSPDKLVGICARRSIELIVGLLGIMKAGTAYLPLDPDYPQERLSVLVKDAGLQWILLQTECANALPPSDARLIHLDQELTEFVLSSKANPIINIAPDQLAYVLYTSGSTGRPKAVGVPHKGLWNRLLWMQERFNLSAADAVLQKTPYSFDVSVWEFFWPLLVGARLVITAPNDHKNPDRLIALINMHSVTTIHFVPSMLRVFLEASAVNCCPTLKQVICSGEALTAELRQLFFARHNAELHNLYGPTEASIDVTAWQCQKADTDPCVPIGRPIANTRTYILDRHFNPVPVGVPGELCLGGVQLARAYLNRPDLTAERFIPDSYSGLEGERLYRTGDLAYYRADGNIDYLGRIDRQVKIRGFRIELGEIEACLLQHPLVKETVVIVQEQPSIGKRLIAYVVKRASSVDSDALRAHLKAMLPEYMQPALFIFLETLPLTVSGKLDRKALPVADGNQLASAGYIAPSNPTEQTLEGHWRDVLGIERIGINDDFFALGGHSILATQLLFRVREEFSCAIPLLDLFQTPTIAAQARLLAMDEANEHANAGSIDWQAESVLDESIRPLAAYCPEVALKSVFLTGATGFLGAFLLQELLQQTPMVIYCLVRATSTAQGFEKVRHNLDSYGLWRNDFSSRIYPVCGDLTKPLLGIQASQWQQLAQDIDVIYHNGALVNFTYPYSTLKPANVLGTQEVLRLACTTKNKPVHYISTVSVFEDNLDLSLNTVMEEDFPEDGATLVGGYAQSKWVAEKLVREASCRGLPASIYRPSIITGDSRSGVWNTGDYLSKVIGSCLLLGKVPMQEALFNAVPVDYASRALIFLSGQSQGIGKTYHLTNPSPLSSNQLFAWACAADLALERVDFNDWLKELRNLVGNSSDHPFFSLVPMLDQERANLTNNNESPERVLIFDHRHVSAGLSGTGISCPIPDQHLWQLYFHYLQKAYAGYSSVAV